MITQQLNMRSMFSCSTGGPSRVVPHGRGTQLRVEAATPSPDHAPVLADRDRRTDAQVRSSGEASTSSSSSAPSEAPQQRGGPSGRGGIRAGRAGRGTRTTSLPLRNSGDSRALEVTQGHVREPSSGSTVRDPQQLQRMHLSALRAARTVPKLLEHHRLHGALWGAAAVAHATYYLTQKLWQGRSGQVAADMAAGLYDEGALQHMVRNLISAAGRMAPRAAAATGSSGLHEQWQHAGDSGAGATFNADECCMMLWSLARLQGLALLSSEQAGAVARGVAVALQDALKADAKSASKQMACMGIWACARLGLTDAELWGALGGAVAHHLPLLSARELSNVLWALATAGRAPPGLLPALCTACMPAMESFNSHDVGNTLWALGRLGYDPGPAFLRAAEVAVVRCAPHMLAQEAANSMWGLAAMLPVPSQPAAGVAVAVGRPGSSAGPVASGGEAFGAGGYGSIPDGGWAEDTPTRTYKPCAWPAALKALSARLLTLARMSQQQLAVDRQVLGGGSGSIHGPHDGATSASGRVRASASEEIVLPGHWVQVLWALAHSRLEPDMALVGAAASSLTAQLGRISLRESASVAWALGSIRHTSCKLVNSLLLRAAGLPRAQLSRDPVSLVLLLWAAAWLCMADQAAPAWHDPGSPPPGPPGDNGAQIAGPERGAATGSGSVSDGSPSNLSPAPAQAAGGAASPSAGEMQEDVQRAFATLAAALQDAVHTLEPSYLCMLLWALARSGYHTFHLAHITQSSPQRQRQQQQYQDQEQPSALPHPPVVAACALACRALLRRLRPREAAGAVWALAVLRQPCPELLEEVAKELTRVRGATTVSRSSSGGRKVIRRRQRAGRRWWLAWATGRAHRWRLLDTLSPQELTKVMWAFAAAGHVNEQLYFACSVRVMRLLQAGSQLAAAQSKRSGRAGSAVRLGILKAVKRSVPVNLSRIPVAHRKALRARLALGPGSVAQLMWAFAMVGFTDEVLAEKLASQALEVRGQLQPRDVAAIAWSLGATCAPASSSPAGGESGNAAGSGGWELGSGGAADTLLEYCLEVAAHGAMSSSGSRSSGGRRRAGVPAQRHFSGSQLSVVLWAAAMAGYYTPATAALAARTTALLRAASAGTGSCGYTLEDAGRAVWALAAVRHYDHQLLQAVGARAGQELSVAAAALAAAAAAAAAGRKGRGQRSGRSIAKAPPPPLVTPLDPSPILMLLIGYASWMRYDAVLFSGAAAALAPSLESMTVEDLVSVAWCFSLGLLTSTGTSGGALASGDGTDRVIAARTCAALLRRVGMLLGSMHPGAFVRRELRQLAQASAAAAAWAAAASIHAGTAIDSPLRLPPQLQAAAWANWTAPTPSSSRRRVVVDLCHALHTLSCDGNSIATDARCPATGVPIDITAVQRQQGGSDSGTASETRYAVLLCPDEMLSRIPAPAGGTAPAVSTPLPGAGAAVLAPLALRMHLLQQEGWAVVVVGVAWWQALARAHDQKQELSELLKKARTMVMAGGGAPAVAAVSYVRSLAWQ